MEFIWKALMFNKKNNINCSYSVKLKGIFYSWGVSFVKISITNLFICAPQWQMPKVQKND